VDAVTPPTDPTVILGVEALRWLCRGMSYAEAGQRMGLHADAVRTRLRRFYRAVGANNAAQAVAIAGVAGWLTTADLRAAVAARRWVDRNASKEG
jgi:DNA-binding CsgD family transcriptional regulator